MFRSEPMSRCQILIQPESAYLSIAAFGEVGCVQFEDISLKEPQVFRKKFMYELIFCDEIRERLKTLQLRLISNHIPLMPCAEPSAPTWKNLQKIDYITKHLTEDLAEMCSNIKSIKENLIKFTLMKEVLVKVSAMSRHHSPLILSTLGRQYLSHDDEETGYKGNIRLIAGVIPIERLLNFEKMLWPVCRGNLLYRCDPIQNSIECPGTGEKVYQTVFEIFVHGNELEQRISKVCQGFHATIYPCPLEDAERIELIEICEGEIAESRLILKTTTEQKQEVLGNIAKNFKKWQVQVEKANSIYTVLNMLNVDLLTNCLIGEFWIPTTDISFARKALMKIFTKSNGLIEPIMREIEMQKEPPTHFKLNKYTRGFQALIDAYGVPGYNEINPSPFTVVTFPFLFAVMFGDVGHGIILTLFAAWLVKKEKVFGRLLVNKEIWSILFGGRYVILLMGLFSIYTGLVYNDFFSISLNIFGSGWKQNLNNTNTQLNPTITFGTTYAFGLDPVWQLAQNKIIFHNAFKMKMSIIFGVFHMIFALFLSFANFRHFENIPAIFCEFLPQLLFFCCLFLYLVFLMFFKWIMYNAANSSVAPSILLTFVNMILMKETPLMMYHHQEFVQNCFLFLAFLCIPWMLVAKPLYIHVLRRRSQDYSGEPMSEIIVHQSIHTIEYILGSVSHTASYLRLWALSLAHAQLAEVLWSMVFREGLRMSGSLSGIWLSAIFAIWALATVAILVVMEGLSAFLHTLRLHWVEFQSKFYVGQGYHFIPFSFKEILNKIQN